VPEVVAEQPRQIRGEDAPVCGSMPVVAVSLDAWRRLNEPLAKHECSRKEQLYESVGKSLLVGRVGEACEIARAYLFLMQEGYGTGQIVVLDGGAVLV